MSADEGSYVVVEQTVSSGRRRYQARRGSTFDIARAERFTKQRAEIRAAILARDAERGGGHYEVWVETVDG